MGFLSSLLIALAMLVSSITMAGGSAAAMPHEGGMAADAVAVAGHCAGTDAPADHQAPDPGMSCIAACAAFPALPPVIGEPRLLARTLHPVAGQQHLPGVELEGETPPPRMTLKI